MRRSRRSPLALTSHAPDPLAPIVDAVRSVVGERAQPEPLHAPTIGGNAWRWVKDCLDTGWVSSAGRYVDRFEEMLAQLTGGHAVAVANGTAALHVALQLAGVRPGDEVIAPALTFVAPANAIRYCGAVPHFVDIEDESLGLDVNEVRKRVTDRFAEGRNGLHHRQTGRRLAAILGVHVFGNCFDAEAMRSLCDELGVPLIEDAAEAIGSSRNGTPAGTTGLFGTLSFNGNKTITTGGGGAILTQNEDLATAAKHLTTTAKRSHSWEYFHDQVGYNYRLPNLNAALGCAQLEQLPRLLEAKRRVAERYVEAFADLRGLEILRPPEGTQSNHWLNALVLDPERAHLREPLLVALNEAGYQCRPIWQPMHRLPTFEDCPRGLLPVTESLAARVINLPSSAHLDPDLRLEES